MLTETMQWLKAFGYMLGYLTLGAVILGAIVGVIFLAVKGIKYLYSKFLASFFLFIGRAIEELLYAITTLIIIPLAKLAWNIIACLWVYLRPIIKQSVKAVGISAGVLVLWGLVLLCWLDRLNHFWPCALATLLIGASLSIALILLLVIAQLTMIVAKRKFLFDSFKELSQVSAIIFGFGLFVLAPLLSIAPMMALD